jgi:hypothetical protein
MNMTESRALHGAAFHIVVLLATQPQKLWTRSELEEWCLYPDNAILKALSYLKHAGYVIIHGNPKKPAGYRYNESNPLNLPFQSAVEEWSSGAGNGGGPSLSFEEENLRSEPVDNYPGTGRGEDDPPPPLVATPSGNGRYSSPRDKNRPPHSEEVSLKCNQSPRNGEVRAGSGDDRLRNKCEKPPRKGEVPPRQWPVSPRNRVVFPRTGQKPPRNGEEWPTSRRSGLYTIQEYRSSLELDTKKPEEKELLHVSGTSYSVPDSPRSAAIPDRELLRRLDFQDTPENRLLWLRAGGLNPRARSTRALAYDLDVDTIAAHVLLFVWEVVECRRPHSAGLLVTRLRERDVAPRFRCQDCLAPVDACLCGVVLR